MNSEHGDLLAKINDTGGYDDEIEAEFKSSLEEFKATQTW
jgi:F-type H+-transporting ATPase subunit alpha